MRQLNFNHYIGQERIKGILKNFIIRNRLSHAYSFEGVVGMGKLTLAKIFATAILCHDKEEAACEKCISCRKMLSGNHPDFTIISSEKSSIGIEEIRNIQDKIIVKPIESERKVYIIDQADKMTAQAQNCLLKTLEEPPPYVVIILCVSNINAILKTIQSRCTRINFDNYSNEEIKSIICTQNVSDSQVIDFAVSFSQGVVGKAFSIISEDFLKLREEVLQVLKSIRVQPIEEMFKIAGFFESNKDDIDNIFDIMVTWFRDIAIYQHLKDENILINYDKKGIIFNSISEYNKVDLVCSVNIIEKARKNIKININFQMAIENMLLNLWEVNNGKSCRSSI